MPHFINEQLLQELSGRIQDTSRYTLENELIGNVSNLSSTLESAINQTVKQFAENEIANEFGLPGGTLMPDPPEWWIKFLESCSIEKFSKDWENIKDDLDNGWRYEQTALSKSMRVNFTATGGKSGLVRPESTKDNIPTVNVDVVLNLKLAKRGPTNPSGGRAVAPSGNFLNFSTKKKDNDTLYRVTGKVTHLMSNGAPVETDNEFSKDWRFTEKEAEQDSIEWDKSPNSAPLRIEMKIKEY